MRYIDKLERKYGRFGISNLTAIIIGCYVVGYLLEVMQPQLVPYLSLEPGLILRGQVWRLVTWLLIPPDSLDLFTIIMLFFYYSLGTTLERTWGRFRYTLYIMSGLIFTVIGAFLLYLITGDALTGAYRYIFTTYYISLSIFLAFALSYPEMRVMLYFVLPIKIKWMAYVYVAIIGYNIFTYVRNGIWMMAVPIIASLLNFIIFFIGTRNLNHISPKEVKRKAKFQKAMAQSRAEYSEGAKHKCAICGRTEKDDPNLEFRFCSKCNGNYEYCQDHLFTHEHVK